MNNTNIGHLCFEYESSSIPSDETNEIVYTRQIVCFPLYSTVDLWQMLSYLSILAIHTCLPSLFKTMI